MKKVITLAITLAFVITAAPAQAAYVGWRVTEYFLPENGGHATITDWFSSAYDNFDSNAPTIGYLIYDVAVDAITHEPLYLNRAVVLEALQTQDFDFIDKMPEMTLKFFFHEFNPGDVEGPPVFLNGHNPDGSMDYFLTLLVINGDNYYLSFGDYGDGGVFDGNTPIFGIGFMGGKSYPDWSVGVMVPEPTTGILVLGGAALLLLRRRRA